MISMLAVALTISSPVAATIPQVVRPGSLSGYVEARLDGFGLSCQNVLLLPRTEEINKQIQLYFGTVNEGVRSLSFKELQHGRSGLEKAEGVREDNCDGSLSYQFRNVPPGLYYLIATLVLDLPGGAFADRASTRRESGVDLLRRVEIRPGSKVKLDIELD